MNWIADHGAPKSEASRLIIYGISFEETQRIRPRYLNVDQIVQTATAAELVPENMILKTRVRNHAGYLVCMLSA